MRPSLIASLTSALVLATSLTGTSGAVAVPGRPTDAVAAAADTGHVAAKGVAAWSFPGARTALRRSGADWYYDWSTSDAVGVPSKFVPMVWGAGSADPADLARRSAADTSC